MASSIKRQMKEMENKQKAEQTLSDLQEQEKEIEKSIEKLSEDAKQEILNNNEEGFELIAESIFYFEDLKRMLHSIYVQFKTYAITANVMSSTNGIRDVLKATSKQMAKMPSLEQNSKDFAKFKRSLMKGQLNMKAFASMMKNINPASSSSRSKEEFATLREKLMAGNKSNINVNTNTSFEENKDFFSKINGN